MEHAMHSTPAPRPPTPFQIDDALAVVHSPHLVHDQPHRRAVAWETLMRERGHRVDRNRIGDLQDGLRRAHLQVVANTACRLAAARLAPPVAEAPFWDDVDPAAFDHPAFVPPTFDGAA
jgi:hypothetical protein